MKNQKILCGGGINSCWYIGYIDHGDNTITVTMHDSFGRDNYDAHPKITHNHSYQLMESTGRTLEALEVPAWSGNILRLRNPKYVFGFR